MALEASVLDALREWLVAPEVYAGFVRGFTAEWNAEQRGRAVMQEGQRDELKRLAHKIDNLVCVIGESGGSAPILSALKEAETRKAALENELAVAAAPTPQLLPNIDALYREKVTALHMRSRAARERIRALITEVRLMPSPTDPRAPLAVAVRGALAAMLALGSGVERGRVVCAGVADQVGCGGRI